MALFSEPVRFAVGQPVSLPVPPMPRRWYWPPEPQRGHWVQSRRRWYWPPEPQRGDWIQQRRWSKVKTVFYTDHYPIGEPVDDLGIVQGSGLYMGPVHAVHFSEMFIAVQVPHPKQRFELVWTNVYAFDDWVDYHFVVHKSVLDGWYQKGWVNEFLDE